MCYCASRISLPQPLSEILSPSIFSLPFFPLSSIFKTRSKQKFVGSCVGFEEHLLHVILKVSSSISNSVEIIGPTLVSYSIYSLSTLTAIRNYHILDNPIIILLSLNIPISIYIILPLTEILSFHPYFFSSQP